MHMCKVYCIDFSASKLQRSNKLTFSLIYITLKKLYLLFGFDLLKICTLIWSNICVQRITSNSRWDWLLMDMILQDSSVYDLDIYLNRSCMMDNFSSPAFLITYNINNGVQIVGHAVDPPPYSKVSAFALYVIYTL